MLGGLMDKTTIDFGSREGREPTLEDVVGFLMFQFSFNGGIKEYIRGLTPEGIQKLNMSLELIKNQYPDLVDTVTACLDQVNGERQRREQELQQEVS